MSQDDEETIKYNKHHYIYTVKTTTTTANDQTRRNGPLYENYMLNDNNNKKPDQLETVRSKSDQFNNVYRFESNTTNDASYLEDFEANDIRTICSETTTTNATYDTYENISLRVKDTYDKRELLQKYFRSALVGPRTNIYENLCRGCNYGVFNARGPLCTFCECLVNGVTALGNSNTPEPSLDTSNNIYENICEICDAIYSGSDCLECKCRKFDEVNTAATESKQGSEEVLIEKSVKEKKKVKINKSKSFNKSNKPKIFTNLWDTLRKPKNSGELGSKRKPLEIVHNVGGYEQVFHTKDTFDLQKICELKRSTTSCSDQHIYGRLKQSDLALSQEEFNSTQSLTQPVTQPGLGGVTKKPRISKPKFLRTQNSINKSSSIESDFQIPDCTIYLNTSVCHWMTSLRREIHVYNTTFNQLTEESQCYPKSIPSKNALISCKAPVTQPQSNNTTTTKPTNNINNIYQDFVNVGGIGDLTEILQMLKTHNSMSSMDSWNLEEEDEDEKQIDCYQLMVEEFMANIINRQQMLKTSKDNNNKQKQQQQQQQHQQIDNVKVMAGVNNNDIYNNNNIPLRQALEPTATTATTMTTGNHNNRHKRQGMYLRLEDQQHLQTEQQQQQQLYKGKEQINLHNNNDQYKNNNNNTDEEFIFKQHGKRDLNEEHNVQNENLNSLNNLSTEHNTVTTPNTRFTNDHSNVVDTIQRNSPGSESKWHLIKMDKRRGIHERNVLQAFEALLEQERCNHLLNSQEDLELDIKTLSDRAKEHCEDHSVELKPLESQSFRPEEEIVNNTRSSSSLQLQTFGDDPQSITQYFPTQIFDIIQLINQQQLSAGLNTSIICYDKYLKIFLQFVYLKNTKTRTLVYKIPNKQLVRKFQQFYNYCEKSAIAAITTATTSSCTNKTFSKTKPKTPVRESTCVSSNLKLDLNVTCDLTKELKRENNNNNFINNNESLNYLNLKTTSITAKEFNNITEQKEIIPKVKTPPQVPKRDPKTKLSPTAEIKRFLNSSSKMTVPANNLKTDTNSSEGKQEEESIYQPIWKFETRGKVPERYQTDDDYYDLKELKEKLQQESPNSEIPKILISSETLHEEEEEDHNNWEPDEEFVFTKEMKKQRSSSLSSERLSNIRSSHSSNSSLAASLSLSGSTITEFASSTATLASTVSTSLRHYLFRNIGIFYSLTEPKLRAIIYDYDRIHSSRYFAKPLTNQQVNINDSGLGKSLSPLQPPKKYSSKSSLNYSTPSTSANSSPVAANKREILNKSSSSSAAATSSSSSSALCSESVNKAKVPSSPTQTYHIPSSVQAWKYQLLDVNYMEDEEDMIVSECEILRAQQIKEDLDQSSQSQPQQFIQRFKSRSTENFIDLPIEDDKKTFTERLANMYTRFSPIQRGILNINGRNSPKSDKKTYKLNRASQSTSLYLEDGLKPKKPIFGAPLDQLELQQNVPRFVVDAVEYIERKDRIIQDGIYRACGNKFSIDELKQKLSKSYIYDSKLIVADDIHTVTSLLKQFFRDLPEPVVTQEIYSRITANLADKQSVDTIRIAIEELKEPNKSTLRFLIKHLTNVAACSSSNRMNASNMAIVWGPSLFAQNDTYDMIGRMNTLTKVLIENYDRIFDTNERLL
ncbi:rho GTPase activating protein at 18B isoform 1-T4 [Cochliomyia hominivorax]